MRRETGNVKRGWRRLVPMAVFGVGCASSSPAPSTASTMSAAPAQPAATAVTAPPAIDVVELTISDIHAAFERGDLTALALTLAHLARIETFESHYNAFISMNPDALQDAAALDAEYAANGPRGPLHGVPVVIKDNIDQAGRVTTVGFDGFSSAAGGVDMIPDDDAAITERLEAAGAIILGKTNLPDFAGHGTRTNSSVAGKTLNPYNTEFAPGGSSGGTATAVNASFAVLGLGTETGGSIQNPAAAQALVGIKPTYGLVPLEGVYPLNGSYVDVAGPLARTVEDAAIALDVIAGPTTEDLATFAAAEHIPAEGYVSALEEGALAGQRFGLVGEGWRQRFLPLAPETEVEYRQAIAALEARGAEVVEDPFAGTDFIELYRERPRVPTLSAYDQFVYFQGLGPGAPFHSIDEWETLSGREFRRRGRAQPARPSATEAGDAFQAWRMEIRALFRSVLEEHDLDGLFFPQAGGPIRPMIENPDSLSYNPNNHPELPSNIINDIGLPVITVPFSYYENNTPFVVAFIGDLWSEMDLIGWAYDFEQATRGRVPPALTRD